MLAAALGAIAVLPSLPVGLLVDDYVHKVMLQRSWGPIPLSNPPWDLFRFLEGDPRQATAAMDYGVLPWWSDLHVKAAFWRPLASATHWLDYQLWPGSPALMHAHSIAWYALAVAIVARLYRRLMGYTIAAGLAAILYAIDSTHSTPVFFLAHRNTFIAAVFGVLGLLCHQRWRTTGSRWHGALALALFAIALLAKEEAVAVCAYLFAFALFLDRGPLPRRLATLLPYGVVLTAWRIVWRMLGYGVSSMDLYIDPLQEPVVFIAAAIRRVPILLLSEITQIPADLSTMFSWFGAISVVSAISCVLLAWAVWPVLRSEPTARFWATGTLLSLVPAATVLPSDRMLFFAGIGAMALLAQLIMAVVRRQVSGTTLRQRIVAALTWTLAVVHLLLAPVLLAARTAAPAIWRQHIDAVTSAAPLDPAALQQDVVIINAPLAIAATWTVPFTWAANHDPMPRQFRVLCSSLFHPVEVRRLDERTLAIRPAIGFLPSFDRMFCSKDLKLPLGWTRKLRGCEITVTALRPDRRPSEATFRFDVPLEDSSLRWLQWKNGAYVPVEVPEVGHTLKLIAGRNQAESKAN
jgi:hypothetical protein